MTENGARDPRTPQTQTPAQAQAQAQTQAQAQAQAEHPHPGSPGHRAPSEPVKLETMDGPEFAAWAAAVRRRWAERRVAAGSVAAQEAEILTASIVARLLPDGPATPGHQLWTARRDDRDVGTLWLFVEDAEATLYDLAPADGAGASDAEALLAAAEDEARARGAHGLRVYVFSTDAPLRAAADRRGGYTVAATQMRLSLDAAAATGNAESRVDLRPMSDARRARFRVQTEDDYADDLARSGTESDPAAARERAAREIAEMLPGGRPTDQQRLWTIIAAPDTDVAAPGTGTSTGTDIDTAASDGNGPAPRDVGYLWIQDDERPDGVHAFVLDVVIDEPFRRRGLGRAAMAAAAADCRARGVASIGLSVFGFNTGARALYESLGYRPTEETLRKRW